MSKYSFSDWNYHNNGAYKEIYASNYKELSIAVISLFDNYVLFMSHLSDPEYDVRHLDRLFNQLYEKSDNMIENTKLVDDFISKLDMIEVFQ